MSDTFDAVVNLNFNIAEQKRLSWLDLRELTMSCAPQKLSNI